MDVSAGQGGPGGEGGKRREMLDGLLDRSTESHRMAIKRLDGKAKAVLTAGSIVMGIVMGGMGAVIGLGDGATVPPAWLLEGLHPCVVCAIAGLVVGSLAAIFMSVCFAVNALRVVRMKSFGNADTFMGERTDGADKKVIDAWISAPIEHVYERVYDARVVELKDLEGQSVDMGRNVGRGQYSLLVGLALSLAWSVILVLAWAGAYGAGAP